MEQRKKTAEEDINALLDALPYKAVVRKEEGRYIWWCAGTKGFASTFLDAAKAAAQHAFETQLAWIRRTEVHLEKDVSRQLREALTTQINVSRIFANQERLEGFQSLQTLYLGQVDYAEKTLKRLEEEQKEVQDGRAN